MRIGVVSDSHDNARAVAHAAAEFRARRVDFVLHAGDVTTPRTLAAFREFPGAVAFGNNDRDEAGLARQARAMGWTASRSWSGILGGATVVLLHGHQKGRLRAATASSADVVVHGHSHRARDEVVEGTRVLNPGALFRAAQYSVGVLDLDSGTFEIVPVPKVG